MLSMLLPFLLLPFATAAPSIGRKLPTASFVPYETYQCNLGLGPTQSQSTLVNGTCTSFSPRALASIPGYQGYKAKLDSSAPSGWDCWMVFHEDGDCGTVGQTTNEIPVPTDFTECKDIPFDILGKVISNGARSVVMTCEGK